MSDEYGFVPGVLVCQMDCHNAGEATAFLEDFTDRLVIAKSLVSVFREEYVVFSENGFFKRIVILISFLFGEIVPEYGSCGARKDPAIASDGVFVLGKVRHDFTQFRKALHGFFTDHASSVYQIGAVAAVSTLQDLQQPSHFLLVGQEDTNAHGAVRGEQGLQLRQDVDSFGNSFHVAYLGIDDHRAGYAVLHQGREVTKKRGSGVNVPDGLNNRVNRA